MADILPYTCILEDCSKASTFYMTRETWLSHMQNDHEGTEQWVCQACSQKNIYISFQEAADFTAHLQQQHDKRIKPQQIPMLLSAWRRKVPFEISACPLCCFASDDKNALLDHTAEHIHSFSLRALPWGPDEDLEEAKENPQEVEYFKTHPYFDIGSTQSELSSASLGLSSSSVGSLVRSLEKSSSITDPRLYDLEDLGDCLDEEQEQEQQQLTGDILDQVPHDTSNETMMGNWLQQLDDSSDIMGPSELDPLTLWEGANGVQWLAFEYSQDGVKMEYTIRCDTESVDVDSLDQDFKTENCVYPQSFVSGDKYSFVYETECNALGWALAELNPALRGKQGLIQRAVDSWRNSSKDPSLRSRRIRRLRPGKSSDAMPNSSLEGQIGTSNNPDSSPAPSALPPTANREDEETKEDADEVWGRLVSLDNSGNKPFAITQIEIPFYHKSDSTRIPGRYLFGRDSECGE